MENETETERIVMDMDRETLSEMCEETWGHSLGAIVEEMRDFDVLNQPMFVEESQLSHEERVVQFFVDMVNRI
tara:strand:- start:183 stop:401 length:219 start_codon:yes stop_codon:yes gene_type:complete